MTTEKDDFLYKRHNENHQIEYYDIRGIRIEKGLIWDALIITTQSSNIHLEGLSGKTASSLAQDLESRVKRNIIARLIKNENALTEIENQTQEPLQSERYLFQTDIRLWVNQFPIRYCQVK